jgi:hypothetical protein
MTQKYLLYIDVLGFSDLVRDRPEEVRRLYRIIENLNCHKHDTFRVIVFSDTILVYNREDPFTDQEHSYIVMYLIEFAGDLLYSTIGKNFFFRAVLVHGEFEHVRPRQVERFFGRALIKAYQDEKKIAATGLFIDAEAQRHNDIFPVAPFNDEYSFVYLNQSLGRLESGQFGRIPVPKDLLRDVDGQWDLAKDFRLLADIHSLMQSHADQRVRDKYRATWNMYEQQYPKVVALLEKNKFDPKCISLDLDWRDAIKRIQDGYRGNGVTPPTINELDDIFEEARNAGTDAARSECKARLGDENPPSDRYLLPCGGALIYLDVSGRNRLGRFLLNNARGLKRVSIDRDHRGRGLVVSIYDMHGRQERVVDEAAANAALAVLRSRLRVDGWVESYTS